MASVNLALDDIISSKKTGGRRSVGGRRKPVGGGANRRLGNKRSGGSVGREKYFSDDVPSGKWKHDKFFDLYGSGSKKRVGGSGSSGGAKRSGGGGNQIVKLNISNLPETVLTSDLEELFQDFDVLGVAVHYDEGGAHLGTADLFTTPSSAKNILQEYANIAIDGQAIKIGIVDENGGSLRAGIKDRIRRIGGGSPVRRTRGGPRGVNGGGRRRSAGGRVSKPRVGGGGGSSGGAKAANVKQMSVEDLDKELEAYMGGRQGKE